MHPTLIVAVGLASLFTVSQVSAQAQPSEPTPTESQPPEEPTPAKQPGERPPPEEPPSTPAPATCKGSLDGHVVDIASHEPVIGAIVELNAEGIAVTDEDGRFVLTGLCPGEMSVAVSRSDYKPGIRTFRFTKTASLEIELELNVAEEVIVIEGKAIESDMGSTAVLSGEELERTRGRSFSDALSGIPGVAQLGSATGLAKPIVRGQFGRRLVLVVDSVRHRAQEWGLDHAPEIDPFGAESISVIRGAAGVRFGSDAIGGAIVATPTELPRTPGLRAEAHLVAISNGAGGSVAARARDAPKAARGLAWLAEGSYKRLAAARTPNYALNNAGVSEWSVAASAGYKLEDSDFKLSYRHYQARLGVCTCLSVESSDDFFDQLERDEPIGADDFEAGFGIERPSQSAQHDTVIARARFAPESLGTITATYALQWDHRQEFAVVRSATGPQFDFRLWSHDLDVSLRHKVIHLSNHLHLRGRVGVASALQFHDYSGLPLIPDYDSAGGGVFASERLLGHDFELAAGVRYDFLRRSASIVRRDFLRLVRSDQLAEDACGPGEPDPVSCMSTFNTLSASLGGLYQIADALSAKINLSTASRAPNPDEQYLNGTSPTLPVLGLGKPDLDPETTYSATATVSYTGERLAAELSGYGNYIADYIYFAPAIGSDGMPIFDVLVRGTFPRFVTRPVNAIFYGADGGVTAQPLPWLTVSGQVSMVRAENRTDDAPLSFVPPDKVRAAVGVRKLDAWNLRKSFAEVSGTYVAKQGRFDINADLAPPPDAYVVVDAEVGVEKEVSGETVRFAVRGSNLLNRRYRDYTSLLRYFADQPGWQLTFRMSVVVGDD